MYDLVNRGTYEYKGQLCAIQSTLDHTGCHRLTDLCLMECSIGLFFVLS
jgi:hypothetical protein